jgi:hypothetical protein
MVTAWNTYVLYLLFFISGDRDWLHIYIGSCKSNYHTITASEGVFNLLYKHIYLKYQCVFCLISGIGRGFLQMNGTSLLTWSNHFESSVVIYNRCWIFVTNDYGYVSFVVVTILNLMTNTEALAISVPLMVPVVLLLFTFGDTWWKRKYGLVMRFVLFGL